MKQLPLVLPADRPPLHFIAMSFDGKPLAAVPVDEDGRWHAAALWCWLSYHEDRYARDAVYRVDWDRRVERTERRLASRRD